MDKEEIIQALVDANVEDYGEAFNILYPGQDFEQVKKMIYFKKMVKQNPDVKYDFDSWTETRPIDCNPWNLEQSYDVFFEKTADYALFLEATKRLEGKNKQRKEEEARETASKRSKWLKDPKMDEDVY